MDHKQMDQVNNQINVSILVMLKLNLKNLNFGDFTIVKMFHLIDSQVVLPAEELSMHIVNK